MFVVLSLTSASDLHVLYTGSYSFFIEGGTGLITVLSRREMMMMSSSMPRQGLMIMEYVKLMTSRPEIVAWNRRLESSPMTSRSGKQRLRRRRSVLHLTYITFDLMDIVTDMST